MRSIITKDYFGNKYEVSVDDLQLSVHIYGIALRDGKVLILPEFEEDGYSWPGGTMELGETIEETLVREFKEETGLEVEPLKLVRAYSGFFHSRGSGVDRQDVILFYIVKVIGGQISTEGFDADEQNYAREARWVTLPELKTLRHIYSLDISGDILSDIEENI